MSSIRGLWKAIVWSRQARRVLQKGPSKPLLVGLTWLVVTAILATACGPALQTPPTTPTFVPATTTALPARLTSTPTPNPTQTPQPAVSPVASKPVPTTSQPKPGGVLVRYQTADAVSSDVHQETGAPSLWPFVPVYSLLVMADPKDDSRVVGDLAESWQVRDQVQYTFRLRPNAKWHDGQPVRAEDVKFSLDRITNPPKGVTSPRRGLYAGIIDKVEAPDPQTVTIQLKFPAASLLAILSNEWSAILPKHVVEAQSGPMKREPVGSGPFKFKTWVGGSRIEVVKNADFYVKDRPYLDGIMTLVITEPATQIAALRTGRVHVTSQGTRGISFEDAEVLRKEVPGMVIGTSQALNFVGPVLNVKEPPFNDVRVRKAFFLAYDQQEIIDLAAPGSGAPAGVLPSTSDWSLPKEELARVPGVKEVTPKDIEEAKKLLTEAGLGSGLTVTFPVRAEFQPQVRAGEIIRQQLRRVGIAATVQPLADAILFETVNKRTFKVSQAVFSQAVADPDAYLVHYKTGSATNYMGYSDQDIDALIDKQSRTLDVAQRKQMVLDIQRRVLDQYLSRPYWSAIQRMAWWNYVKGLRAPTFCCQTYNSFRDVWLDK